MAHDLVPFHTPFSDIEAAVGNKKFQRQFPAEIPTTDYFTEMTNTLHKPTTI